MLHRLSLFLLLILSISLTFTSAAPIPPHHSSYYPYKPVELTTHFRGSVVPAQTSVQIAWTGGSGQGYEVYYIPQWPGQKTYAPVDIARTSGNSVTWQTPSIDRWPEGTTFIVGVNDVLEGSGSSWYALTRLLNFVAS
ncbi:hypothetical protein BCR39DRAFT_526636 [Naematelia encephala]|uniref:Purple acid phosphatase N-terminal domain-containing protein n=1 Tax=Naematelia encephala TaxID=71784 RepID=A0A1Y2B9I7_9TREE|nr:hypothetical protein BCR39DRAFT_526636 [Naematelia encephala]